MSVVDISVPGCTAPWDFPGGSWEESQSTSSSSSESEGGMTVTSVEDVSSLPGGGLLLPVDECDDVDGLKFSAG